MAAATARGYLADGLARQTNRAAKAGQAYRNALEVMAHTGSPTHPDIAHPLNGLAELLVSEGRADEAAPLLDRSIALVDAEGIHPRELERARALGARLD